MLESIQINKNKLINSYIDTDTDTDTLIGGELMLLSIIIPIYNSKTYLTKCLSSIVSQLDADAEIICVDDGSTDGSEVICDEFAVNYDNVKVFHKPNGGVSSARNLGIENASGKYIAWVDSDDYVADNWYSAIKEILLQDYDIVCFDYFRVGNDKPKMMPYGGKSRILNKAAYIADLTLDDKVLSYLPTRVFKKVLFTELKFPRYISLMEDYSIIHKLFYEAEKIYYLAEPLYFYIIRNGSISHSVNLGNCFKAMFIAKERYQWLTARGVKVSDVAYLKNYLYFVVAVIKEQECDSWKNELELCHQEISRNIKALLLSKDVSIKNKVKYVMEYTNTLNTTYKILSFIKFGGG